MCTCLSAADGLFTKDNICSLSALLRASLIPGRRLSTRFTACPMLGVSRVIAKRTEIADVHPHPRYEIHSTLPTQDFAGQTILTDKTY